MRDNLKSLALPKAVLPLVLALVLPGVAPVRGAVENSPHDLIAQDYHVSSSGTSRERCSLCHLAALAAADLPLFPDVPTSLRGRFGASSLICFSCHDGTTLVALEVDASLTAFHPGSHGGDFTGIHPLPEEGAGQILLDGGRIVCITCHDPHDNSQRPFLRAPPGKLCLQCHPALDGGKAEDQATRGGNHSIGVDPLANARPDIPLKPLPAFRVSFPLTYPLKNGKGTVGTHWDLGGHLLDGQTGELACVTCHAVHGDEEKTPEPPLLALDPVRVIADLFCEGCHFGTRGDGEVSIAAPNPGGTTAGRTYHPCDDDIANGKESIVETRTPDGWPLGGGDPRRLICSTCHTAHRAKADTALLRPPVKAASFCEECHDQLTLVYHHPLGEVPGPCAARLPAGVKDESGGIACDFCHRAHNAGLNAKDEKAFIPILRIDPLAPDFCLICHPAGNPTCAAKPSYDASHFLGDPTLSSTYSDAEPPLRTTPWPESGLLSRYSGENGKGIACYSCHSFHKGTITTGDGGNNYYLVARSGNQVEWGEGGETAYLCTGCHGVSPGTGSGKKGHSHPLMNANIAKVNREVQPPVTVTPSGLVNCDSCHRPHEAITAGGVYILEVITSSNTDPKAIAPQIDYTPVCLSCHDPGRY